MLVLGRLPLYVQHLPVLSTDVQTEVTCGISYTLTVQTPTRTLRYFDYTITCNGNHNHYML